MNMWVFAGGMLIGIVSLFYGFKLAFVGINQATSKGYRHMPGLGMSVYLLLCGTFAWSVFLLLQHTKGLAGMEPLLITFLIACPSSGFGVTLMTALIPHRPSRRAPTSKAHIPFTFFGGLLLALGPALAIFCYTTGILQGSAPLKITSIAITVGLALLGLGRKSRLPGALDLLKIDPRPPILYLRAFSREKDVFAKVSDDGQDYADRHHAERSYRTVEEFLGREINRIVGPFVALGSPLDYVPPDGAARLYSRDDEWQKDFVEIGAKARIIILLPNCSTNLQFELQCARANGWVHKIRVATRPELHLTKWEKISWGMGSWIGGSLVAQRIAPHDWASFVSALTGAGFSAGEDTMKAPPPGSVLSFGSDGRLRLFRHGMATPDEFVRALCEAHGSEITEPAAVAPSTAAPFQGLGQMQQPQPASAVVLALGVAGLVIASVFANARSVVHYYQDQQHEARMLRTLAAMPNSKGVVLMIHEGQPLYVGTRIRTKRGTGVFKPEDTGSVAVIIGEGHTGVVKGLANDMRNIVAIQWDPQKWEEDTLASTWGLPGFYHKRYTQLAGFVATINADWIEITN